MLVPALVLVLLGLVFVLVLGFVPVLVLVPALVLVLVPGQDELGRPGRQAWRAAQSDDPLLGEPSVGVGGLSERVAGHYQPGLSLHLR